MKEAQIRKEGYMRVLSPGLLHPQQEYIYRALQKNKSYQPAFLLMRRKGQEKAALGIGNIITALYFEQGDIYTGLIIPEKQGEQNNTTLAQMLQRHYSYKVITGMLPHTEETMRRELPAEMKEGTPFPFRSSVGNRAGQIKKIIIHPHKELTDRVVDVPLGYGKEAGRYSLWIRYDAIFRILQD